MGEPCQEVDAGGTLGAKESETTRTSSFLLLVGRLAAPSSSGWPNLISRKVAVF